MVHDLRGMFAFAIWDTEQRSLFLARDPYGIKPLYYADDGWTFRFASQVKALLAPGGGLGRRSGSRRAWAGFFLFGSVPSCIPTLRKAVRCLPAGSSLCVTVLTRPKIDCRLSYDQLGLRCGANEGRPRAARHPIDTRAGAG